MATVTLWCETGAHHWERESQRGRKPLNCPEHIPVKETSEPVDRGPSVATIAARERVWSEVKRIADREHCKCRLREDMEADELRAMTGCRWPRYICPALDAYRRRVKADNG